MGGTPGTTYWEGDDDSFGPVLTVVEGGKAPPGRPWIMNLKIGTVFLAKRWNEVLLYEYELISVMDDKVPYLKEISVNEEYWVDPDQFCKQYRLFHIIEEPKDG